MALRSDKAMLLGYNTNGFAHHRLEDAVRVVTGMGYRCVSLSIDHGCLAPGDPATAEQIDWLNREAKANGLRYVIETGARFLLDPQRKHEPTMVSASDEARLRRVEFYRHAIAVAKQTDAVCVSLWSGVLSGDADRATGYTRLIASLAPVLEAAAESGVRIGFEPEPGMLVSTLADYTTLRTRLADAGVDTSMLGLTVDVGHLHCNTEGPLPELIARYSADIVNVHIEDMRRGVHEHLMFGEGEIEFEPLIAELARLRYKGPVSVELSRHSHMAPEAARRSFAFLDPLIRNATS